MSDKPSMGHNPLAYSLKNHASFDFIRNTQDQKESEEENSAPAQKKVASYYLEENIVDAIRAIADKDDNSYSAVANDLLKDALRRK